LNVTDKKLHWSANFGVLRTILAIDINQRHVFTVPPVTQRFDPAR